MRKLSFLFFVLLAISLSAQEGSRWNLGLTYSYQKLNFELTSATTQSFAKGVDLGNYELSDEKIDQINGQNDITKSGNFYGLAFGYDFVKSDVWNISGTFIAGVNSKTMTVDDEILGKQYEITPGDPNYWTSLNFELARNINEKWAIVARPTYAFSWGDDNNIFNSELSETGIMEVSEINKASFHWLSLPLMARYSIGKFRFGAGPEFYQALLKNEATVIKYDPVNDAEYKDIFEYKFSSKDFVAACAMLNWDFMPGFSLSLFAHYANDIQMNASIIYHFNTKNNHDEN